MDNGQAYRATRDRIIGLVVDPDVDAATVVPACPAWTVRDVVAHLAGVCEDITTGNMDGAGTDPWTAEHVSKRAEQPLPTVVDEWRILSEQALELLGDSVPDQLVFDEVTHEHDLRAALDRPGSRDDRAVTVGLQFLGPVLHAMLAAEAPPLRIRSDHQEWDPGDGTRATLSASDFDLLRSGSGRRTRDQIAALDWGGTDPAPWLNAFFYEPFQEPPAPLEHPGVATT